MAEKKSDSTDTDDALEPPPVWFEAQQSPPSRTPCQYCQQLQVRILTTPVRIYAHCTACLWSWNVPNPKAR